MTNWSAAAKHQDLGQRWRAGRSLGRLRAWDTIRVGVSSDLSRHDHDGVVPQELLDGARMMAGSAQRRWRSDGLFARCVKDQPSMLETVSSRPERAVEDAKELLLLERTAAIDATIQQMADDVVTWVHSAFQRHLPEELVDGAVGASRMVRRGPPTGWCGAIGASTR